MHTYWTHAEQKALLRSYSKLRESYPDCAEQVLVEMAQRVLPKERRRKISPSLIRWMRSQLATDAHESTTLTGLVERLLPRDPRGQSDIVVRSSVKIASSVVAGVLRDPRVRGALKEVIGSGLAEFANSADSRIAPVASNRAVLLLGVSEREAESLRREFSVLSITRWQHRFGLQALEHLSAAADLVLSLKQLSRHQRSTLQRSGHQYIHQADGLDLRAKRVAI